MNTAENRVSEHPRVICLQEDLIPNSGICALIDGQQVAIFYLPDEVPHVYAIGNWDPIGKANVLSRGVVGDVQGRLVVASPLYKQHYDLTTGQCLENEDVTVPTYAIELVGSQVVVTP